jgi:predicted ATPase
MNDQKTLLKSIMLKNFLSFGRESTAIPLTNLNVIIGPNGSGKSNFIEAMSVLQAVPRDLPFPIRQGGGVRDWLWKGKESAENAVIEPVFSKGRIALFPPNDPAIRYRLVFGLEGESFVVIDERIENETPNQGESEPYFYYAYENGRPMLNVKGEKRRQLRREDIDPTQSILSQRRDPESYPEVSRLADLLRGFLVYRTWSFGPNSPLRMSCAPDVRTDRLAEDFSNLPARLAVLKRTPNVKKQLVGLLKELSPGFDDIEIVPEGGQLQLYLTEGSQSFPARRLSDGTLRFLSMLAILLDPTPPPLVVIEEPELGLHPDILPVLRDLLVTASESCQLIVTTHSTQFVDAMTDHADSVMVCEKQAGSTNMTRLSQEQIDKWREHGSLGKLWMDGQIGGARW